MTVALIDADIIAYRASAKTMDRFDDVLIGDPKTAIREADLLVEHWTRVVKPNKIIMCWSCPSRVYFRHDIYPEYKGNRKGSESPPALGAVIEYLKDKHQSVHFAGLEADDVLGILSGHPDLTNPVVISIDKDMHTLPTKFYNPDRMTRPIKQNRGMADRLVYKQALTGDSVDNYRGIPGIGPAKAEKILDSGSQQNLWQSTVAAFVDNRLTTKYAITMMQLARILRFEDYNYTTGEVRLWHPTETIWHKPSALPTTSSETASKPSITLLQSAKSSKATKRSASATSSSTSADTPSKAVRKRTSKKRSGISKGSSSSSTKVVSND